MPLNARDKSFLSGNPAGIDKLRMHLDSPIKMGKWSNIEALYSTLPLLCPQGVGAPCATLTSTTTSFLCTYTQWKSMGMAEKAKKQVTQKNLFEVKNGTWQKVIFTRNNNEPMWHCIIYMSSSCMYKFCTILFGNSDCFNNKEMLKIKSRVKT